MNTSFATTHWSMVLSAGRDETEARQALESLCRTYWRPLYIYVRRRGFSPHDAEDLTQAFFQQLLARGSIDRADPARGRFRSFLLGAMKHFLADEHDRAHALKRGAGKVFPFDPLSAETWLQSCAVEEEAPDRVYEKRWALALLEEVYHRLEAAYSDEGKQALFDALRPALTAAGAPAPQAGTAAELAMSPGALRVAVHRLRRRYRDLIRQAVAEYVASPDDIEDELRYLQSVLSR